MDKHKQAQRVKNNARPSKSGRSAELLQTLKNPYVGFGAFDGNAGNSVPVKTFTSPIFDDADSNLDVQFQLVLKKMNKKNGTTKLKALKEFTELVDSSEPEAVKQVLVFWPRIYVVMAVDVDHRVREATHQAHLAVFKKVQRNIAPHLKQLIGPWFTSQYDTYPLAAAAAIQSFQTAFPDSKMEAAIATFQNELLQYISNNICDQSAEILSKTMEIKAEEAESKYERILISSLNGYSSYLKLTSSAKIETAKDINLSIVSNKRFWMLSKIKTPLIRAAWFGCIIAICQKALFLIKEHEKRLIGTVFANIDDNNSIVLNCVWEAVMLIVTNIQDWWTYVRMEELVLPKLWKVIREGGQGSAAIIYPSLLPLVSNLPLTVTDSNNFYNTLFENIKKGITKENVLHNRTELLAIPSAFIEIIKYIILKNISDVSRCQSLIENELIFIIKWSLTSNLKPAIYKHVFTEIAAVINYWYKYTETEGYENYKLFVEYFWFNLEKYLLESLKYLDTNCELSEKQVELLLMLKKKKASKKSVHFDKTKNENLSSNIDTFSSNYVKDLNNLAYKICEQYLMYIKEKNTSLMSSFLTMLQEFENTNLFTYLNKKSDKYIDIYNSLLKTILLTHSTELTIDVIFILFKYLDNEEKKEILVSLSEIDVKDCLFWTAKRAVHYPYCEDENVKTWLLSAKVGELLCMFTKKLVDDDLKSDELLFLKDILCQTRSNDILISQEACQTIINTLCDGILDPEKSSHETLFSFVAQFSSTIYNDQKQLQTYGDQLVLALFTLSCNSQKLTDSNITPDTILEVKTAWQDVISLFITENITSELQMLIRKLTKKIQYIFITENFLLDDIKNVSVDLIKTIIAKNKNEEMLNFILNAVFSLPEELRSTISNLNNYCVCAEIFNNKNAYFNYIPDVHWETENNLDLMKYLNWNQYILKVFMDLCMKSNKKENDEEEDEIDTDEDDVLPCVEVLLLENVHNVIVSLLYCYGRIKCFAYNYKNTKYYSTISGTLEEIESQYRSFIETILIPNNIQNDIFNKLQTDTNDHTWAMYYFIIIKDLFFSNVNVPSLYRNLIKSASLSDLNRVQLTQWFSSNLNYDTVMEPKNMMEKIIITRAMINCEDIVQIAEAMSILKRLKEKEEPVLLFNKNISSLSWKETQLSIEVMRFITSLIEIKQVNLVMAFCLISIPAWASSVEKSKQYYSNINVANFISVFCELFRAFENCISNTEYMETLPSNCLQYFNEYKDLFSQDVHCIVLNTWIYIADNESSNQESFNIKKLPMLSKVGNVISHVDSKCLMKQNSKQTYFQQLITLSCKLLSSSTIVLQLWGYYGLQRISEKRDEREGDSITQFKENIFDKLKDTLIFKQEMVQTMLLPFRLGIDTCRVEPHTDSYGFTLGYLLLWDIFLNLCNNATTDLHFEYIESLSTGEHVKDLLNNLFRLMPTEVLECCSSTMETFFMTRPSLELTDESTFEKLEHLVCRIYRQMVGHLPALVRQWWRDAPSQLASTVESVTMAYVSPHVSNEELQDVIEKEKLVKHNMKINVHLGSGEVIAVYLLDEVRMELVITLPSNYPLEPVEVEFDCGSQVAGPSQWRNWVMQLRMFLTHQNGSIWDGLMLWKNNLDKKFDGVEECYICFSVLHNITYQLPKLVCQTCKKKFHSTCLYKWFSTSNKSTCPICRNLF